MDMKKYKRMALLSLLINSASIFNAVLAIWSILILLFAFFVNSNIKHSSRIQKDKKLLGFAQTAMLGIFIFLSTGQTFIGIVTLNYVVQTYLASYQVIFILLAVIGIVIYYYFCILLFKETLRLAKQREVTT